MKKLLFIIFLIFISCNKEEETRIFTVTTFANPPEGGIVTLETTQGPTTGEYKWGEIANLIAKPAAGYSFISFSGNTYIGDVIVTTGNGADKIPPLKTSLEMRCRDITFCEYDIIITGNFVKKD